TKVTHFGMDACRACTAFYRVIEYMTCVGQGKSDAHQIDLIPDGIYACRKCRLDRFEAVLAAGKTDETNIDSSDNSPSSSSPSPEQPIEMTNTLDPGK
ncbi:hypothetical protein PENTCL1PPCAC_14053, partial [Pristionchus entomophagus]